MLLDKGRSRSLDGPRMVVVSLDGPRFEVMACFALRKGCPSPKTVVPAALKHHHGGVTNTMSLTIFDSMKSKHSKNLYTPLEGSWKWMTWPLG